ncbi:hypothetical protein DNTS_030204, partial [Danionella cerebrum]
FIAVGLGRTSLWRWRCCFMDKRVFPPHQQVALKPRRVAWPQPASNLSRSSRRGSRTVATSGGRLCYDERPGVCRAGRSGSGGPGRDHHRDSVAAALEPAARDRPLARPRDTDLALERGVCEPQCQLLPAAGAPARRYDQRSVDRDTGISAAYSCNQTEPDVYPVSVISEDPGGLQGSCMFFREREEVSEQIRNPHMKPLVTLQEAQERWGEKLVLVGSQQLRYRSLIGPEGNPEVKLPDMCYCILERLGRARWQGELQRDLHTHSFRMEAGKLHYLRSKLDRNGLITPYGQKEAEEEDDENNDEDGEASVRRSNLSEPRAIERDVLSQAYGIVVAAETRGISQSVLREKLNVGKLEGRMICKLLERLGMITGFMEDEGRQRTTKYISKLFVQQSELSLQFTKERQRSQHLRHTHLTEPAPAAVLKQEVNPVMKGEKTKHPKASSVSGVRFTPVVCLCLSENAPSRGGGAKASKKTCDSAPSSDFSQSEATESQASVIEEVTVEEVVKKGEVHETYRLLKRKNMILEAVRCSKIIEGFYMLQKLLVEEERKDGINTKLCKKSVLRLVQALSREGLVKVYRTIVVQDGVQKKVEFVVHPSVSLDDPLVKSGIEQVRLRMSSYASATRVQPPSEKVKSTPPEAKEPKPSRASQRPAVKKTSIKVKPFSPVLVPGLGRALGFQSKMPRLRIIHSFLWYLIYGHPDRPTAPSDLPFHTKSLSAPPTEAQVPAPAEDRAAPEECGGQTSMLSDEDGVTQQQFRVYVAENSWKRYTPPTPLHRGFGSGWALISDVLLSLPLSIFIQVVQINYQVDGLDQYLNDPVKKHYLIRFLPSETKRQLLHKRKYIFSFHESLQRLCYMGLLQFSPSEKFMDKDQTRATIVDTTVCDPHYNRAIESLRPFERRHYEFRSPQDVENYWFNLMFVCLNSPLGVIRPRPEDDHSDENEVLEQNRLRYTLEGSCEVVDDGVTPGDGQGAGGLDSSFFGHLKRNWMWTSHLINSSKQGSQDTGESQTFRLRNLLLRNLPAKPSSLFGLKATPPVLLEEEVRITTEPTATVQQKNGGKNLKRKREKMEKRRVEGKMRKRVRSRSSLQDDADRQALLQMTRQRVSWTHTEDSLLMLCRVASHFLNRKLKRPFVPWAVVRDVLHAEVDSAQDKTSLSVSRRSRYIMKNPQTFLNYRICQAEMYQDKELTSRFLKRTGDYDEVQVCAAEYKELVSALRSKFSSSYGSGEVVLPDSREQLFSRFKVFAVGDEEHEHMEDILKEEEDIDVLVVFNLIQSTLVLTNAQMKHYRPFQSFCQYTRFSESVLSRAFYTCRSRGLVNRRRPLFTHKHTFHMKKSQSLPFLPMSYQLSQHYYKFFTWRFPSSVFTEAFNLLSELYERSPVDRDNSFSFQKAPEEQSEETVDGLQFPMDAPGGASAACLTLLSLGLVSLSVGIPEQIIVLDSTAMDASLLSSITKALEEEEDDDEEEESVKRRLEIKPTQASHTNYLLLRGCYTHTALLRTQSRSTLLRAQSHPCNNTDNIMVNSCSVRLRLRETPQHVLFPGTASTASSLSPHTHPSLPLSLSRVYDLIAPDLRSFLDECVRVYGYTPQDEQALLEVRRRVAEGKEYGVDTLQLMERHAYLKEQRKGRAHTLDHYIQALLEGGLLLEVGALSRRLVCLEASSHWLLEAMSQADHPAPRGIPTLDTTPPAKRRGSEAEVLTGVNTSDTTAVAMETLSTAAHQTVTMDTAVSQASGEEPTGGVPSGELGGGGGVVKALSKAECLWVVEGARGPDAADHEPRGVGFVSRPWRVADGSLNAPVCKGMMEALLLHIMSSPALNESALLQHYRHTLQPTAVLDLLRVLMSLGCVRRRACVPQIKPSLFSTPALPQVQDRSNLFALSAPEDSGKVFYEPTLDCVLRLSRVFPHELNWNRWVQQ